MNDTLKVCMEQVRMFKNTIPQTEGITTYAYYEGAHGKYDAYFLVFLNGVDFLQVTNWDNDTWMVYINNPNCDVDENGHPIFTDEHPNVQWVFGYYKSFKRALNKVRSIVNSRTYPKPIEIHS